MLQGEMGDKAVKMAIENPQNYVLKPQREGGGSCYVVKLFVMISI